MGETTNISWCDHTWSPWYGCTQVSLGEHGACVGCYARQISETRMKRVVFGGPGRGIGTRDVRADSAWAEPLRWNRTTPGAFVFPSMCDPSDNHPDLGEPRLRFFDLIHATPRLTWLLLTKRPQNILPLWLATLRAERERAGIGGEAPSDGQLLAHYPWPKNAAIGCTVVTQAEADRDIPHLLRAKAALKPAFAFLSMEPLLDAVTLPRVDFHCDLCGGTGVLARWPKGRCLHCKGRGDIPRISTFPKFGTPNVPMVGIDWVITGGETDQGKHKARPSNPDWFRSLRDQCAAAGVAYHHKQNGEWSGPGPHLPGDLNPREIVRYDGRPVFRVGKALAGRLLDGVEHNARPQVSA